MKDLTIDAVGKLHDIFEQLDFIGCPIPDNEESAKQIAMHIVLDLSINIEFFNDLMNELTGKDRDSWRKDSVTKCVGIIEEGLLSLGKFGVALIVRLINTRYMPVKEAIKMMETELMNNLQSQKESIGLGK